MNPIFKYEMTILEHHLDTFGHMNHAVYLEICEEARWELITQNGYGMDEIKRTGMGPTILEIIIRYSKELRLRQKITIETQLVSYKGKIGVLCQYIKNDKGEVCCTLEMKFGLFDVRERKLVPPTPAWLRAIGGGMSEAPPEN